MTDWSWRALCAELVMSWDVDGCDWKPQHQSRWNATVDRARAALAQQEPPADGEVAELVEWLRATGDLIQPEHLSEHQRYKRAADLLERLQPLPTTTETAHD